MPPGKHSYDMVRVDEWRGDRVRSLTTLRGSVRSEMIYLRERQTLFLIKYLLAQAASCKDFGFLVVNISVAFMHARTDEEIYVKVPGFKSSRFWQLKAAVNGTRKASKHWPIEENRQAAESEAKEKERKMKQIRRAETENERLEETDNHNAKDNDDTMAEARADDSTTEETDSKARADYLATEAKGNKARPAEDSNRHEAAVITIHEQREEFPFVMGREIPRNEIRMVIDQRTETGMQTSETGQRVGEQWESQWRNNNWGKRFDYWGVGKQRIPVGLRERRSQQWCRTEDVRTIKEGDVNTDKWRIETPPGISKQECNEDKLDSRITKLEEQTKWMYDRMMAAAAESSTWNRGIPWSTTTMKTNGKGGKEAGGSGSIKMI